MSYEFIDYQVSEGVSRITLNRPDKLNSFNSAMARELQRAIHDAAGATAVRAVYLTGAGRGFCAGQDLDEALREPHEPAFDLGEVVRGSYNPIVSGLRRLAKPVVCGVNGVAAGAGANLALACDIVIASERASFIQSFCKIGLIPDSGGTYYLPRLVGFARASAMAMLGEKLTAAEALAMGLIYKVVAPEDLDDEAFGLAARLATQPTAALGLIKEALNRSLASDLDKQLELEADLQARAGQTDDFREGVRAFVEKRPPRFTGR